MPVILNWTERLFQARHGSDNESTSTSSNKTRPSAEAAHGGGLRSSALPDPTDPISAPPYRPPSTKTMGNPSKLTAVGLRACLINPINIAATDLRKPVCSLAKIPATRKQIVRELRRQNFSLQAILTAAGRTVALKQENHEQYLAAARSYLSTLLNVQAVIQYQTQQLPPVVPHMCAAYYAEQIVAHAAVFIRNKDMHPLWKQSNRGMQLRNVLEQYYEKLAFMLFSLMQGTVVALEPKYGKILQRKMDSYYKQREQHEKDKKPYFPPVKPPTRTARPSNFFRNLQVHPLQPEQLHSRYWNRQTLCKLSEFTARWMMYCCLPKEQQRELERALNALHGPVVTSTLHYTLVPDEKMYEQMQRDKRKLEISLRGLPNEVIQQAVGKFKETLFKFYDDYVMKSIAWDADDDLIMHRAGIISINTVITAAKRETTTNVPITTTTKKKSSRIIASPGVGGQQQFSHHSTVAERTKAAHTITRYAHKHSPPYTKLLIEGKVQTVQPADLELPEQADDLIELKNGQMFRKAMVPVYPQSQQQHSQPSSYDNDAASTNNPAVVPESRSITICRPVKMGRHRHSSCSSSSSEDDDDDVVENKRRKHDNSFKRIVRRNRDKNDGKRPVRPRNVGYRRWTEIPRPLHKHYFTESNITSTNSTVKKSISAASLTTNLGKQEQTVPPPPKPVPQYDEHAHMLFVTMREWAHQIGLVSVILEEKVDYTVWPAALLNMLTDFNVSRRITGCLLLLHLKPVEPQELLTAAAADSAIVVTADFVRKCQRHAEKLRTGRAKYIEALRVIVNDIRENEQVRKAATMALVYENHLQFINNNSSDKYPHDARPRYSSNSNETQVLLKMLYNTARADRVAGCVFLAFCRIRADRLVHELGVWLFGTSTNKATSEQPPPAALTTRKILQYACAQVGQYDSRMVTVIFSGVSSFHYENRLIALESLPQVVCASPLSAQFFTYDMKLHVAMLCLTEQHPQVKQRACWAVSKLGLGQPLHRLIVQTLQCRGHSVKTYPAGTESTTTKVDSFTKLNGLTTLRTANANDSNGVMVLTGDVIETILSALRDPSHIIRLEAIKCIGSNCLLNQSLLDEICETVQTDALEIVRDAAVKAILCVPNALAQSCVRTALLFMVRFEDSASIRRKIIERLLREPLYAGASDFYDALRKKMLAAESREVGEQLKSALNRMEQQHPELKATRMESSKSGASAFDEAGADENIAQMVKANLDGYVAQQHLKQIMYRVACRMRHRKHDEFRQMFIKHFYEPKQQPAVTGQKSKLDEFFTELGTTVDTKNATSTEKPQKAKSYNPERLLKYVETTVSKHKHYGVRRSTPIMMASAENEPLVKHWVNKYEMDSETGRLTVKDEWKLQHDMQSS